MALLVKVSIYRKVNWRLTAHSHHGLFACYWVQMVIFSKSCLTWYDTSLAYVRCYRQAVDHIWDCCPGLVAAWHSVLEAFYLWWFFGSQRPVGAIPLFQSFSLPSVFSRLDEQPTVVWASLCTGSFGGYVYLLVLSPIEGGTHLSALPLYPIYQRASLPLWWSSWRAWKNCETSFHLHKSYCSLSARDEKVQRGWNPASLIDLMHTCIPAGWVQVWKAQRGRGRWSLRSCFVPQWATLSHPGPPHPCAYPDQ